MALDHSQWALGYFSMRFHLVRYAGLILVGCACTCCEQNAPFSSSRLPHLRHGLLLFQEEQDFPIWIRYAHKHMLAEGHKLNLLINLWQMVVRHPDLFYKFRTQFLAQMVNTLSRLRLPANASMENRRMAVDMARVIVEWEVRRVKSSTASQPSGTTGNPAQIPKLPIVKKEEDNAPGRVPPLFNEQSALKQAPEAVGEIFIVLGATQLHLAAS